jgi:AraC-like DNA-binding protein
MTVARRADLFAYLTAKPPGDGRAEITTVGHQHVAPHSQYPPPGHPKSHAFAWKDGRQLNEHHLVYVPTGAGRFETGRKVLDVVAGDLIFVHKGDWHRYRPRDETGWEAYWVGFKGTDFEKHGFGNGFSRRKSILQSPGYRPELIELFDQLIELSKRGTPIFKAVSLGCLSEILRYVTTRGVANKSAAHDVAGLSIAFVRRNLFAAVDFHELASDLGISYSRFRSVFKDTTGIAPHQFVLNERIACAKRLLRNPAVEIKTVGYKTGFRSAAYFSRIFRRKTGTTASAERARRD